MQLGDAGQGGERQLGGGEPQVAVAALEADLGLEADAGAGEAPPRPRAQRPFEPVLHAVGMRAAAHRFAVGVEDQRRDIGQPFDAFIASASRPCSRSMARLAGICPTKRPASENPVWIATRPRTLA